MTTDKIEEQIEGVTLNFRRSTVTTIGGVRTAIIEYTAQIPDDAFWEKVRDRARTIRLFAEEDFASQIRLALRGKIDSLEAELRAAKFENERLSKDNEYLDSRIKYYQGILRGFCFEEP